AYYNTALNKIPTVSINWAGWKEVGMAANMTLQDSLVRHALEIVETHDNHLGYNMISPEEGAEAFGGILTSNLPQVIVSPENISTLIEKTEQLSKSLLTSKKNGQHFSRSKYPRPTLSTTYNPPTNQMEQRLVNLWQDVLGIELVGIND